MRLYALVTSLDPLTIYLNREGICYHDEASPALSIVSSVCDHHHTPTLHPTGLARFGTQPYVVDDIKNLYAHLTNTSINKYSPSLADDKGDVGPGCKVRSWSRQ